MSLDVACHLNVLVPDLGQPQLDGALGALAELGYSSVVLPPIDPAGTPFAELKATFAQRGLAPIPIAGQAPDADVSSSDADVRRRGEDVLRRMVDATVALGGDQLNGVPYGLFGGADSPASAEAFERSARSVGAVADYAHDQGVTMTFEVLNRYETSMVNTASQARDYVAASGSDHLRIHLDSFHMAIEESDAIEAVRGTVPLLGYLELGQSGRGPLSTGSADVGGVLRAALASGYRGRIGVEAFSRSILSEFASDLLRIWRTPFDDGVALAADAIALIREVESRVPLVE